MKLKVTTMIFVLTVLLSCQTNKTTPDNSILLNNDFELTDNIETKFNGATNKSYESKYVFEEINATIKIDLKCLEKDSLNSIIKNVTVTLIKGAKNHEFSAQGNPIQDNNGKKEAFKTSSIISVGYYTENTKGKEFTNKVFQLTSKGEIKELN